MSAPLAAARMSGADGSVVIFVHGVGSTAAIWDAQLRELGTHYRCFAVELRGNGVSKPEPGPEKISREGFAQDVLTIADAAGDGRFHFVGCSLGGVVGLELCRIAPGRIRSLTLVGSYAAYDDGPAYAESVAAGVRRAGSMERFARERAALLNLPPGPRTEETVAQMACKSVASYIAATFATWTGDYRALLPSIKVPLLAVCGERDTVAPARYSHEIAQAVPGARIEILKDAGHVTNADAPTPFNDLLESFLKEIP